MRWFRSDDHLSHLNICKPEYANRPFDSVEEMNVALIRNHNHFVAPDDEVIFVGDVAMGKIAESLPLVARMNGRKTLVFGNHDRMFGAKNAKLDRWMAEYHKYFEVIVPSMTLEIAGQKVLVNHFPYQGDSHDEDRYSDLRPKDEGLWLLHGHVHSKEFIFGERQIHVGVDSTVANYGPISEDQIANVIV